VTNAKFVDEVLGSGDRLAGVDGRKRAVRILSVGPNSNAYNVHLPLAIVAHSLVVLIGHFGSVAQANSVALNASSIQSLSVWDRARKAQARVSGEAAARYGSEDREGALRSLGRAHRAVLRNDPSPVLLAESASLHTASNQALDLAGSADAVISASVRPSQGVLDDR
jgi:hypothetical protein